MRLLSEAYIGESIHDWLIIYDLLKKGKLPGQIFFLCVNPEASNLMEIIYSNDLFEKRYKDHMIIGIAKGRNEAFMLVTSIVRSYIETNDLKNFRQHFKEGQYEDI